MNDSRLNLPRRVFLKRMTALGGLVVSGSLLAACGENSAVTPALPTAGLTSTSTPVAPPVPTPTSVPVATAAPTSTSPTVAKPTPAPPATPTKPGAVAPAGFTALGPLANFKDAATAPVAFKVENTTGFVFLKSGTYLAYSNICTHQGCEVGYNSAQGNLICPCHSSRFSKEGVVTAGPARLNLADFSTQVVGDTLYGKLK